MFVCTQHVSVSLLWTSYYLSILHAGAISRCKLQITQNVIEQYKDPGITDSFWATALRVKQLVHE